MASLHDPSNHEVHQTNNEKFCARISKNFFNIKVKSVRGLSLFFTFFRIPVDEALVVTEGMETEVIFDEASYIWMTVPVGYKEKQKELKEMKKRQMKGVEVPLDYI